MESKQFFDEVAEEWDEMRPNFYSDRVREKAFALAEVEDGKIAADLGAGTGFITEGLLSRGLRVIAVDQSEAMLALMKAKFSTFDGVDYRQGDASKLPLDDASVRYVFANMYLHHVESPSRAIKEMARILEPEGQLTLTDVVAHPFEFLKFEHHDRWLGFKSQQVEDWFVMAGLKEVSVREIDEECRVQSIETEEEAVMKIFAATGRK